MKIKVTSKNIDNGVITTRERDLAINDAGAFLRHFIDKGEETKEVGAKIKEASKALKIPYRTLKKMMLDAVLGMLSGKEIEDSTDIEYDATKTEEEIEA